MKLSGKQISAAYETYLRAYPLIAVSDNAPVVSKHLTQSGDVPIEHAYATARAAKDYKDGALLGSEAFEQTVREDLDAPAPTKAKEGDVSPPTQEG